jgi:hypothetical protein
MKISKLAIAKLKLQAKLLRRALRRLNATLKHGSLAESPILFANSFPKSGTHLLTQVLIGFVNLGPVVDSGLPAILTFDGSTGQPRSLPVILRDLHRLRPGDMAYGHLHALPEVRALLCRDGVAAFFIYRDPRDVVVSHVHYVTWMEPNHVHHAYYRDALQTFDERLRVSILGRPELDVPFPDIRGRFEPYLGWLDHPEVLCLHFEDFIRSRDKTLRQVLEHARVRGLHVAVGEQQALQVLESAINPERSPTFRSGTIGKWREAFSSGHKTLFKEVAGDLLIRLGYEHGYDW